LLDWAARAGQFSGPVVEIADSYTLLAEDQPAKLTERLEQFLTETDRAGSAAARQS
jgi:hypothetical protein